MSGFSGIINLDGAPAEPHQLGNMIALAARHGNGDPIVRSDGCIALSVVPLGGTGYADPGQASLTLDGVHWITGDVRLDDRERLLERLAARGQPTHATESDLSLVLQAFGTWGKECVHYLEGDFAFVGWSVQSRSALCARSPFGIKPLYYSLHGKQLLFANDIGALRKTASVSEELNDSAIADFLAFGHNYDERTTTFRDIQRVPPGHCITLDASARPRFRRFEKAIPAKPIRYKRDEEYADHFQEVFGSAVADRARAPKASFELSGGLDSTSVAAQAMQLNAGTVEFALGLTTVYSDIDPNDREAWFAGKVAGKYGMSHVCIQAGKAEDLFAYCNTAEPYDWPFAATTLRFRKHAREHANRLLSGQGGDPLFEGSGNALLDSYRELPLPAFSLRLVQAAIRRRSVRGLGLRTLVDNLKEPQIPPRLPNWLNTDAVKAAGSLDRWQAAWQVTPVHGKTRLADHVLQQMNHPFWTHLFENYYHDLLFGIDCRHPFFDFRVLRFLLAIPQSQKEDKRLLRNAMAGALPGEILDRPKAVMMTDLVRESLHHVIPSDPEILRGISGLRWIEPDAYRSALQRYVDADTEGANMQLSLIHI